MSTFDQNNLEETQPYVAPDGDMDQPKKSRWGGCLMGCLIVGAISALVCGGVAYYSYTQAPKLIVQASREVVKAMLNESDLPGEEQSAILTEFDRVGDAFVSGDLSWQGLGELMQDLMESPVMSLMVIEGIEAKYLDDSGLTDEEKEEARQTLQRIATAVMSDQFNQSEIESLTRHVLENPGSSDPAEKQKLKNSMTDEELRAFFAEAKDLCDAKEVPFEESTMQISDKLREIIDRKLAQP